MQFNHTMLRISDPQKSISFYHDQFGMDVIYKMDVENLEFTNYFLGFNVPSSILSGSVDIQKQYALSTPGILELCHNWKTDPGFTGYHNGNTEPRGFGHIGFNVPDLEEICLKLENNKVEFIKKPNQGKMKGIAFVKDPDGYWIELLEKGGTKIEL